MSTTAPVLDLKEDILRLKKEKNAVILAHNYQIGSIQDIADYVGDSLGLAYKAQETEADVIAFCGVHFMAETAKILNPEKTVILPDKDAGCSLEQACPANKLEAFLKENEGKNYYVIAYINCSAGVKALCDVICTSGNAPNIVNQAPKDRPILFVPDENLGNWVIEQTGRQMDLWKGNCYVHVEFTPKIHSKNKRRSPGRGSRRPPRVPQSSATPSRRSLFDGKDDSLLQQHARSKYYYCYRIRNASPPPKRSSR